MSAPEALISQVIGELSSRGGQILAMEGAGGVILVTAHVARDGLQGYEHALQALGEGRATCEIDLDHFTRLDEEVMEPLFPLALRV